MTQLEEMTQIARTILKEYFHLHNCSDTEKCTARNRARIIQGNPDHNHQGRIHIHIHNQWRHIHIHIHIQLSQIHIHVHIPQGHIHIHIHIHQGHAIITTYAYK